MSTPSTETNPKSFWARHLEGFLRILAPLYGLLIISTILDQTISGQVEAMLRSPQGTPPTIWVFALISLVVSVLFPLLQIMVVSFSMNHRPESPVQIQEFMGERFPQLLIEELRAWGQCLFFSLLLIIPGLIRLLQLLFVPFVVLFDASYAAGEVDALKKSRLIFNKFWGQTLTLVILFYLVLPLLVTTLFDSQRNYFAHPFFALGLNFFEAIMAYTAIVWLYSIYTKAASKSETNLVKENVNGTHV